MAIVRRTYVISDLHLGGSYGNAEDPNDRGFRICSQRSVLTKFVDELASRPTGGEQTELVINGDLVDFLAEGKGSPPAWTPFMSDGREAAATFETIVARDRPFFDALGRFLDGGHRLVLLLGNHDVELALPAVRRALTDALHITGPRDFQFICDGEAYIVGNDALIEHGNRYDEWNTVDHEALRKLRSWQSRNQPPDAAYRFEACAGSRLVCDVINPIKASYRFVDLLKPETAAVIPLLLALEPGYRSFLRQAAWLRAVAWPHRMATPAHPRYGGDIAATGATFGDIGGDLAATPTAVRRGPSVDPLQAVLERVMPGEAAGFLAAIEEGQPQTGSPYGDVGGDIAWTSETINRGFGLMRLLTARKHEQLERRLPSLLKALRVLQDDRTFDRWVETLPEYLNAAKALSQGGFRFVLFGHTHLARQVGIGHDATYLNTGSWTDRIRFPGNVVCGPEPQALEALRAFVQDMAAGRLTDWVSFSPTYVRLDVDDSGRVACDGLLEYEPGKPL